ncbi:VRR-NUC domain-containing protein [Alicyclobacillus sp. ALC3]|uniref:VRR-NUC domain-containing protein n=1 Tax=Alicyclobacillus sp. ALC3 TaxID=2796143 RepID=UPI0023791579|nr:VRR-NUC domain-containing protein [Alicyclobacillus sp. ALC3]WDL96921.1 VRR-NUC domain-containing protein [Alicyclobacillus sp. ALC3]
MTQTRERDIEAHLRDRIKAAGGLAYKFESPGNAGVPDRLVLMPSGRVAFVELKQKGKKPTKLQEVQHRRIRSLGFRVEVCDSKEAVDRFVADITQAGEAE